MGFLWEASKNIYFSKWPGQYVGVGGKEKLTFLMLEKNPKKNLANKLEPLKKELSVASLSTY